MPALSRPSSLSPLAESCIERELSVAAENAEKNRSIELNKEKRTETRRVQLSLSETTAFERASEKPDLFARNEIIELSGKSRNDCKHVLKIVEQGSLDSSHSHDNSEKSQDYSSGVFSLGTIEGLIGNWANAINFAIFQEQDTKQNWIIEIRANNGDQLVLM